MCSDLDQCFSTFLHRGTLGQLYQYLVAPMDAEIGLKFNKNYNWWNPWNYITAL